MPESDTTQTTVFGEQLDKQAEIATTGRTIRPWKQLIEQVLQSRRGNPEYRLEFDSGGIHCRMVDGPNVIMLDTTLYAGSFDGYEVAEPFAVGVSQSIMGNVVQHARYGKSTDDDISLSISNDAIESIVSRDLHGVPATFSERSAVIDPESIREKPDLPDLEFSVSVDLPVRTWIDVIDALDTKDAKLEATSAGLSLKSETDTDNTHVQLAVETDGSASGACAQYSMDYLERISKALHVGKIDTLSDVRFGDDYPMMLDFERDGLYDGTIMVAPRVKANE